MSACRRSLLGTPRKLLIQERKRSLSVAITTCATKSRSSENYRMTMRRRWNY